MSLGSSDMAGSALGTAFSLLLLASIIQGSQDVEVFHYKKMEAVAGQDVVLPCTVNGRSDLKLVSIEWSKNINEITKMAVYSPSYGMHLFWPNVSIQIEMKTLGSNLHLPEVSKWDSGVYICEIATFPLGSIRRETQLEIKEIKCDANGTLEVHAGENVTIHCTALPDVRYRWTKNKELVSEKESLELSWVTDAHGGAYTLTVNTGNSTLHKQFTITVLTATTGSVTDPVTQSAPSNVTEEGLINSTYSSPTTSPAPGRSTTIDTSVTWSVGTDGTDVNPNPGNVTTTPGEHANTTHISDTITPAIHTDTSHFNTSTDQEVNPTHASNTSTLSDQSVASDPSTTQSYGRTEFRSTQEMRNESMPHTVHAQFNTSASPEESSTVGNISGNSNIPDAAPTLSSVNTGNTEGTGGARSHLLLLLIIVPALVLIAVAGFIYRKQMIKHRMDLPPPFKPPPPPVKYTAARQSDFSTQRFPTSRCNSVAFENRIITPDTLHIDR